MGTVLDTVLSFHLLPIFAVTQPTLSYPSIVCRFTFEEYFVDSWEKHPQPDLPGCCLSWGSVPFSFCCDTFWEFPSPMQDIAQAEALGDQEPITRYYKMVKRSLASPPTSTWAMGNSGPVLLLSFCPSLPVKWARILTSLRNRKRKILLRVLSSHEGKGISLLYSKDCNDLSTKCP